MNRPATRWSIGLAIVPWNLTMVMPVIHAVGAAIRQMHHRVDVTDCLPYVLRVEQVERGRRGHRELMTAVMQQWDGHPPENPRRTGHEDAHAAQTRVTATAS